MILNEYRRNFYRLLNEGAAEMYRDSYYPEVDDYILEKIIEIDPDSNGDNLSEYGKLLLKLNPSMSDFAQLKQDIEIYAKADKNGVEVPEVKTVEELHYAAVDLSNANAHMSQDEISTMKQGLGDTVFEDGNFKVYRITNSNAAREFGKGTMWIWAANGGKMFDEYSQRGGIFVIETAKGDRYSAIKMGKRLRITDTQDENVDKSKFPSELLNSLMGEMSESKKVKMSKKELINFLTEAVVRKINGKCK